MAIDSNIKLAHMVKHKFYALNYVERRMLVLQGIVDELQRDLQKSQEEMQQSSQSQCDGSEVRYKTELIIFINSNENDHEEHSRNDGGGESRGQNKPNEIRSVCNGEDREELSHNVRRGDRLESRGLESSNNDEEPTSESKLLILLDIEEGLRMLPQNEEHIELWQKLITVMRHDMDIVIRERPHAYYVERFDEHEEYILRMMWESNDSVWLLKTDQWGVRQWHILEKVRDFMKQVHSADIQSEPYPKTRPDKEQLLSTFRERIHQWKIRSECLRRQYLYLHGMLDCWSHQKQVIAHWFGKKKIRRYELSCRHGVCVT